jgi:hypothetical protein
VTSSNRRLAGGATIVALLAAVVALQIARERRFATATASEEFLYLTSPAAATRLALSFDALVADFYWIRAIQYFGSTRLAPGGDRNYALLHPLLDLTTSLDPHFSIAYRFGAFFLSEPAPGGAGRPDLAVRLLEKAMRVHERRWEYPHDIAFVFYRERDYRTAAQWFQRAADVPGAPTWLRPLAAVTLATGGDTALSRAVWKHLLESEADWLRQAAEYRLRQLDAIDQTAQLERLVVEYERRLGRRPESWDDMIRARMLNRLPTDPAGFPYVLNPATRDVTVSERSPMWPLPTERPT